MAVRVLHTLKAKTCVPLGRPGGGLNDHPPAPFPRKGVTVVRVLRTLRVKTCVPLGQPGGGAQP